MIAYGSSCMADALNPTPNHTAEGPANVIVTKAAMASTSTRMSTRSLVWPAALVTAPPPRPLQGTVDFRF
jgi:hypothetical protein